MQPQALLLGSLGVIVDTSDLQRQSFNHAFSEAGLDWHWDRNTYDHLLSVVGGQNRIAAFAEEQGVEVDAAALHKAKSSRFQAQMRAGTLTPRRGVKTLIGAAKAAGLPVGWVTTTSRANLDGVFDGLAGAITPADFDVIIDRSQVRASKPDPECYLLALQTLGIYAAHALSIEDTPESLTAAHLAGTHCIAFPGAVPPNSTWETARAVVGDLSGLLNAEPVG